MFRQVFLTIPDEMLESARIDGAKPIFQNKLFLSSCLYTDGTNIFENIVFEMEAAEQQPQWNIIMMTALLAMKDRHCDANRGNG